MRVAKVGRNMTKDSELKVILPLTGITFGIIILEDKQTRSLKMARTKVGSNMSVLPVSGGMVLFSYETPVAMVGLDGTAKRTEKFWSVTTSTHINKWLDGRPAEKIPQSEFYSMVK